MGYLMLENDRYDKAKIGHSKEKISKALSDVVSVYYCSLNGCELTKYEKVCDKFCPYAVRENVREAWSQKNFYRQIAVELLDLKEGDKDSILAKFLNESFESNEKNDVIDALRKLPLYILRDIRDFNPTIIDDVISYLEEEERMFSRSLRKTYVNAKVVGEYVYVDIKDLPNVVKKGTYTSYWEVNSYFGCYVKISDIDNYFLSAIENNKDISKANSEEYFCKVELFKQFLEEKLGLITMLFLTAD